MRGSVGLLIGLALGAGGMYLALRAPWSRAPAAPAPVVAAAPADAGVDGRPAKKRRPRGGGGGPGGAAPGGGAVGPDEGPEETAPVALTETDRRLEWRGDEVALPPRQVSMEGGGDARSLDDGEIRATVDAQAGAVRDCLIQAATGVELRAQVTLKLLVDGQGRVGRTRLEAPRYLFERGLLECARRGAARLRFPSTGAPTVVTVPFTLG